MIMKPRIKPGYRQLCVFGFLLEVALCLSAGGQTPGRERYLLDSGWRFHLNEVNGGATTVVSGISLPNWVWIADNNAPNDAAVMAAPGLNTATWTNVAVGTDVFGNRVGYAWFRTTITNLASLTRPLSLSFLSVDDNATVYLNGTMIGQHSGWSEPFSITVDPSWIASGTNVLAVAVQNTGGPGGIYGGVFLQSGAVAQPAGLLVTQWLWLADDHASTDAPAMTATNLNTSSWQTAVIGQDVFNGRVGYAWFRTSLDVLASSGRPLTLHFLGVDDNASVYLNGVLLAQHTGSAQPFDVGPLDAAWVAGGPNILAVAVQNTSGPGGILAAVSLQSGGDVVPLGTPVTQWLWLADNSATNDAATMTATNLNTSAWQPGTVGQDVFSGRLGSAWFRATLSTPGNTNPPVALHFLGVEDNATVYLNGVLLGQHLGAAQAFDLTPLAAWVAAGPNVLAVAVQNTNGSGGILRPVLLESPAVGQGPAAASYDDSAWRTVHLPHDYIVEGTFTNTADEGHGYLPLTTAWYRQSFTIPVSAQGRSIWLDFDGVYHNSTVWLNGQYLGNWWSGYAPCRYDISQFAICGGTNVLAVHVDPSGSEGWWYEGGGIYRHVWLNIANNLHVTPRGTFVTSAVHGPDASGNASADLTLLTAVTNASSQAQTCTVISQVLGPDGVVVGTVATPMTLAGEMSTNLTQALSEPQARLWSLETPQLYQMLTAIQVNGQVVDTVTTSFGVRSILFDVNNGFFLNGKSVKLNGTCNHQDFAGVGIGMPDNLLYWRIQKLKAMGSNAYRTSHNPPTEALLDACDRLGMLVMAETRHLGDATGQKSDAGTPFTDLSELNAMILRDRNHPSIVLWSMCNEEFNVQGTQHGADIFYAMKNRVRQFDTTRPISAAMNGAEGTGISLVEDLQGCNYLSGGGMDSFHLTFPAELVYGSETTSATTDRGIYAQDTNNGYCTAYNTTAEGSWQPVGVRSYVAGGFVWTGFDYKGEPTPFAWPCVNSHFGIMDMIGRPKDSYYFYQAWWGSKPSVYVFPHWNWTTNGQPISVWCFANTPTVELFLNGVSQGVQTVPSFAHVAWTVPYAAGTLLVKGYAGSVTVATNQVVTTGVPAALVLATDRSTLTADDEDLTVVYASVVDAQGRVVPLASNLVSFSVSGAGYVAGVGNGDPSSHAPDRAAQRMAFNGWCMALVGATNTPGGISLVATSSGLLPGVLNLQSLALTNPPVTPTGLVALAGNASVQLNWTISFGAASYNIKRATVSRGPYTPLGSYTATVFTDTSAANGVAYYYVVSAVNTNGESGVSTEVSATPMPPAALAAPSGLTAARDDGQVSLAWIPSTGAAAYNVLRAAVSGGPYSLIATVSAANYTDTRLTNGTAYYYVVSALNGALASPNSAQASATPVGMGLLVGTIMGTSGSWSNSGNTREKAMDGSTATFFDAPSGNGDWVGIDLGTNVAKVVSKVLFYPRSGFAYRMTGGVFQGANLADFSDATPLSTLTAQPTDGAWTQLLITNLTAFRYLRYLSPNSGFGNVAEVMFFSPGPSVYWVTGAVIGSSGTSNATAAMVFDADITTFFDSTNASGNWVGLDLGTARVISNVRYCPRATNDSRMRNGAFQGANLATFADAVALLTITNTPPDATLTAQMVSNGTAFRYVRYLSPTNSYGDIAEAQFFSTTPVPTVVPAAPTGLTATPGYEQIGLTWTGSVGAVSYNIKRGTSSGGPYTTISNRVATVHMDSGLLPGTYYYVVTAVNAGGESPPSAESAATLVCPTLAAPNGLAATAENGLLSMAWSAVLGASSYNVWRSTNAAGPYALLGSQVTGSDYTDFSITDKAVYYYAIQAVASCQNSTNSNPVAASLAWLNIVPVLGPLSNRTVVAGQTLLVTNVATDANLPAQTLTYSLLAPPAGAVINPATGLLSWRPAIAQSGTTNMITVTVTDNGIPSLGATQTFTVTVLVPAQPVFSAPAINNGTFQTWVSGSSGPDYTVLGSSNLVDWVSVFTTNSPGTPFLFTDSTASPNPRFYRIRLGP